MGEIRNDPDLVAACGLYCGACKAYRKGRCPGCRENRKATWCKVRTCVVEQGWSSCADCTKHADPRDCPKFHNPIARVIGFVLNSDRRSCVFTIRKDGREAFAASMAARGLQTLPRR